MKKSWNWMLFGGLLLSVAALLSYFEVFAAFPITRDFPWVNLPIFAAALTMLGVGLWRAYAQSDKYRGKVFGPIVATLGVAVFALFIFYVFFFSYWLPPADAAPKVGDRMPDFTLPDYNGEPFQLSQVIPALAEGATEDTRAVAESEQSKQWVLLVFYRGHW